MFRSFYYHQGAALFLAKITLLKNIHCLIFLEYFGDVAACRVL